MKNKLLLLFLCITQLIIAQQVTLLQPALRDSDMKLDSIYYYDNSIDDTEKLYLREYFTTFDSEKNPTTITVDYLDGENNITGQDNGILEFWSIDEYYDDHVTLFPIKIINQNKFNPNTTEWLPFIHSKTINDTRFSFFDSKGKIEFSLYNYDENYNLIHANKNEITLLDNQLFENLFYNWDENTNSLEINYKEIYYNTFINNLLSERITKVIYNFTTNIEINSKKEVFNFNENTFEHILLKWNVETNSWTNDEKSTMVYNENNKPFSVLIYKWSNSTSIWNFEKQIVYLYNESGLLSNYLEFFFNGEDDFEYTFIYNFNNLITTYTINHSIDGEYSYTEKYQLYYSPEETNATTDLENTKIKIYPNPTTTILYIESEEKLNYKIHSIQGKLIKKGTALQKINLSSLEKGMYFIHLKSNTLNTTQKIIKE